MATRKMVFPMVDGKRRKCLEFEFLVILVIVMSRAAKSFKIITSKMTMDCCSNAAMAMTKAME
jgi:hypothetical protein